MRKARHLLGLRRVAQGATLRRSDARVGAAARCRWGRGGRELEDEDEEEEDQEVQEGEADEPERR